VTQEADAYRVLDALRQKNFVAFISQPVNDGFYRVQLGPYETHKAARASVEALEQAGYKPFVRR
jgi:cell division septation protein DedD